MERKNMNPQQVDQLLQAASKKLGVPPEQLRSELESGKYDKVLKNMSQKDSAMLQKVNKKNTHSAKTAAAVSGCPYMKRR